MRIIDKTGPLNNPADRDYCIQYMVAVPLIKVNLTAEDCEDSVAADPLIDELRKKMEVVENTQFTVDYLDASKCSSKMVVRLKKCLLNTQSDTVAVVQKGFLC